MRPCSCIILIIIESMNFRIFILLAIFVSPSSVSFQSLEAKTSVRKLASLKSKVFEEVIKNKETINANVIDIKDGYRYSRVMEVQIAADKARGVYVSHLDTITKTYKIIYEMNYYLGGSHHHSGEIDRLIINEDDEAVEVSKLLAKYRYTQNENEKVDIINYFLDRTFEKRELENSDELIDCDSGSVNEKWLEKIIVSFRPYNPTIPPVFLTNIDMSDLMKHAEFHTFHPDNADKKTVQEDGYVRGVIYAWAKDSEYQQEYNKFQTCELTINF